MSVANAVPEGELDYGKLPNRGMDADIASSLQHMSQSEKSVGYQWHPHGF